MLLPDICKADWVNKDRFCFGELVTCMVEVIAMCTLHEEWDSQCH